MADYLKKALFDNGLIPKYARLADLSALKQKLVASNLANVETPGYARKDVDFDFELRRAFARPRIAAALTSPGHIPLANSPGAPPRIRETKASESDAGINGVDVDQEMADLAQNQIIFEFGADMLSRKFRALKNAIRGRE